MNVFFLASLLAGLLNSFLFHADNLAMLQSDPAIAEANFGIGFIATVSAFSLAIPLLLWYFIARRGSNAAKWILVIMTTLGLLMMLPGLAMLASLGALALIMAAAITVLQVVAISYLFRGDAKRWFARKGRIDPASSTIFE